MTIKGSQAPIACRFECALTHIQQTLPSHVFLKVQASQIQPELGVAADMLKRLCVCFVQYCIPRWFQSFFQYLYFTVSDMLSISIFRSVFWALERSSRQIFHPFTQILYKYVLFVFFERKRGSRQVLLTVNTYYFVSTIPKVPTEFSFGIGMVITKKYRRNTDQKYQIGIQLQFCGRPSFVQCVARPSPPLEKSPLLDDGHIGDRQKAGVTTETTLVPYWGLNVGIMEKRRKDQSNLLVPRIAN